MRSGLLRIEDTKHVNRSPRLWIKILLSADWHRIVNQYGSSRNHWFILRYTDTLFHWDDGVWGRRIWFLGLDVGGLPEA